MENMTINYNEELNGIEVVCDGVPAKEVRAFLKDNGFRWHNVKKVWYAKDTEERRTALEAYMSTGEIPKTNTKTKSKVTKTTKKSTPAVNAHESKYGAQVGDIYCRTFGYSMSLVTFYRVLQILTPSRVEIAEIGYTGVDGTTDYMGPAGGYVVPVPDAIRTDRISDNQMRLDRSGNPYICSEREKVYKWDGRPVYVCTWD